ncbi:MAG: hypothetical protein LBC72_00575, partial [Spirochaetaceae bacterium]|nr:hypothetical protein [Spirochaetaceae bacterium]
GPYEAGALKDMAKAGQIGAGFWAREDGSPDWVELTKLPALKGAFSAKAKPDNAPAAKPPAKKK